MTLISRVLASRVTRSGFVAVAASFGGYAITGHWASIHYALGRIGSPVSVLALVATLAALIASIQAWRVLLAGLGSPLPFPAAARISFIGQLGKYLPGLLWLVLAQMELAAEHDVPRRRTGVASGIFVVMLPLCGLLIGLVRLPFTSSSTPYLWMFLALPPALACLHPKVLNYLIGPALRLARRPPLDFPADPSGDREDARLDVSDLGSSTESGSGCWRSASGRPSAWRCRCQSVDSPWPRALATSSSSSRLGQVSGT